MARICPCGRITGTVRAGQQAHGFNHVGDELEPRFFRHGLGAIALFIRIQEVFHQALNGARKQHGQGFGLANETHLHHAPELALCRWDTLLVKGVIGLAFKSAEYIFNFGKLNGAFAVPAVTFRLCAAHAQCNIGGNGAEGAKYGLAGRDQDLFHHVQGKSRGMGGPRAAEGVQHKLAGIMSLFDGNRPE